MSWIEVNGKREHIQTEACQPYSGRQYPARNPVYIWDIIDRLNQDQLKNLVMGYSVHDPRNFEAQLLEIA